MKKLLIVLMAAIIFFGCKEEKELDKGDIKESKNKEAVQTSDKDLSLDSFEEGLHIVDPWIRPAGKNRNTGLFFRVVNNTDKNDTLIATKSDLAKKTEVHETFEKNDMMGMREVEFLEMKAGEVFYFKPMAHHVMLIQLKNALASGEEGEVTLIFKNAGEVKVKATVEDKMPTMKADEMKHEEM